MATVLGIWAHPDDEVFVTGGLMAEAVRRGDRVVCMHMTRGESGLYFRDRVDSETLGAVRETELQRCLKRLGVEEQRFVGYPDGGLVFAPRDELVAHLHDAFAEVRPDMIVTFGPDGYTGHPDHKALSAAVSDAVRLWGKRDALVLQATVPAEWKTRIVPRLDEFDFFWPGHPTDLIDPDVKLRLEGPILDAKVEALYEHASQMQPLFEAYGEGFMREVAATEVFRVGPRAAFRTRVLHDMRRS